MPLPATFTNQLLMTRREAKKLTGIQDGMPVKLHSIATSKVL